MQPQTVPHALRVAHTDLVREIENSLPQFKQGGTYSNPALRRRIEAFVDALYQIPGAQDELVRRATLVDSRCQPGTKFDCARSDAVAALKRLKSKEKRVEQLLASLSNSGCPLFLDDLAQLRQQIEGILRADTMSAEVSETLASWAEACRKLQREAEPLQVEGSRCLYAVHRAADWPVASTDGPVPAYEPDELSLLAALVMSRTGGVYLEHVGTATESLVEWVTRNSTYPEDAGPSSAHVECSTEDAAARLLRVYAANVFDDSIQKAAQFLTASGLTANDKLTNINALMPFPPTASAYQLGTMLGVSASAVKKTDWWKDNRMGHRELVVEDRRSRQSDRAKQSEHRRFDD